jgi:hypothetical protein
MPVLKGFRTLLDAYQFLCEKGNTISQFRYGLNGLVQVCIGHGLLWCRGIMNGFVRRVRQLLHL